MAPAFFARPLGPAWPWGDQRVALQELRAAGDWCCLSDEVSSGGNEVDDDTDTMIPWENSWEIIQDGAPKIAFSCLIFVALW